MVLEQGYEATWFWSSDIKPHGFGAGIRSHMVLEQGYEATWFWSRDMKSHGFGTGI